MVAFSPSSLAAIIAVIVVSVIIVFITVAIVTVISVITAAVSPETPARPLSPRADPLVANYPLVEGGWFDRSANAAGGTDLEDVSGASVATVGSDRDARLDASRWKQFARVARDLGYAPTGPSAGPRPLERGL